MARTRLSRGGDYVPPDANVVARGLFVDAVTRLVPEALQELKALAVQLPSQSIDVVVPDAEQFDHERPLREWCVKFGFTAPMGEAVTRTSKEATPPLSSGWR